MTNLNDSEDWGAATSQRLDATTAALRREASQLALLLLALMVAGCGLLAALYTANAAWSVMGGVLVTMLWLMFIAIIVTLRCLRPEMTLEPMFRNPHLAMPSGDNEDPAAALRAQNEAVRREVIVRSGGQHRLALWLNACRIGVMLSPVVFLFAAGLFWASGWDADSSADDIDSESPVSLQV